MGKTKTLYHVTSQANLASILEHGGIDPTFSQGRLQRAYYCEKSIVTWAIAHCGLKHDWTIREMVILRIKASPHHFFRVSRYPLLCTPIVYRPYAIDSAEAWLKNEERAIAMEDWIENGELWPNERET